MTTFKKKFEEYEATIPLIFQTGSDAEVAQIEKNYRKLYKMVASIREVHDKNFDLIGIGTQPARGPSVKRIRKANDNAVQAEAEVVVENDPLNGEF